MAQVHRYKRIENGIVKKIQGVFAAAGGRVADFFRAIGRFLMRDYTLALVPHSEKRIYNFHIKLVTLLVGILLFFGIAAGFFLYAAAVGSAKGGLTVQDSKLKETQEELDRLREEVNQLSRNARGFETALSKTLSALGTPASLSGGARADSFLGFSAAGDSSREAEDIRRLSGYLSQAMDPVKEIGNMLDKQNGLLTKIPSIWPVKGGIGHYSQYFGSSPDPFTGMTHLHTGVDISTYRQGDSIVATADGKVTVRAYEPNGYGNYLVIEHAYGFRTRYGHMMGFRTGIEAGAEVKQGEIIGYIGNTGRSTGPHLHYEVHMGTDVINPMDYLNMRRNLTR